MEKVLGQDVVTQKDIDNYLSLTMGKGGTDIMTGDPIKALFSPQGTDDQNEWSKTRTLLVMKTWLAAQQGGGGGGGGGGTTTPPDDRIRFSRLTYRHCRHS